MLKIKIHLESLIEEHLEKPEHLANSLEVKMKDFPLKDKIQLFYDIGRKLQHLGYMKLALFVYKRCFYLAEKLNDNNTLAECANKLGIMHRHLGNSEEAIFFYEQALSLFMLLQDDDGISMTKLNLGVLQYQMSNYDEAINLLMDSLKISENFDDYVSVAQAKLNIGLCKEMIGAYDDALSYYEQALLVFKRTDRKPSVVRCLIAIGGLYKRKGEWRQALHYQKKALHKAMEGQNILLIAKCHNLIGYTYTCLWRYVEALEHLELAVLISEKTGNITSLATATSLLGGVYFDLVDYKKAIIYNQRALDLIKDSNDRWRMAMYEGTIGLCMARLGKYDQSIRLLTSTLNTLKEIKQRDGITSAAINLARVYFQINKFDDATNLFKEALTVNESYLQNKQTEALIHLWLGNLELVRFELKGKDEYNTNAQVYLDKALELAYLTEDEAVQKDVYLFLIGKHLLNDDKEKALESGLKMLEYKETTFGGLIEEEHMLGFLKSFTGMYSELILISFDLNQLQSSFLLLEKSKSKAFLHMLKNIDIQISHKEEGLTMLLEKERQLFQQLNEIRFRRLSPETVNISPGTTQNISGQLEEVYSQIKKINPEYVALRSGTTLDYQQVKSILN